MRLRGMISLLVFMTVLLPLVSSSIFIEPLNPIYNYGDTLTVQTKIVPAAASSGHYTVDLKCGSNIGINIFNSFFEIAANEERPVMITTQILNPLLDNVTSLCLLRATYEGDTLNSNSFMISKEINIEAELDFNELAPGRYLSISGEATKESGVLVNGFLELFVDSLGLYKSATVSNGLFNVSLLLPADSKSGKHKVSIEIYNTDQNSRKINSGSFADEFTVSQVLKEVNIVTKEDSIELDKDFIFTVDARDQAGDLITRDVSITINDPRGNPFVKKVIKSGEQQSLRLYLNNSPGYWSIETTVDTFTKRKLFYLSEIQKIQTSLINDTLFVTNIGNSPYRGPLEITIGSQVEVKQIKLDVGETQKLTLRAPDGDYSISVSDGEEAQNLGSTFLTGNAVKITDFREDVIETITNPLIWWLAIILFVLIIILVQVKIRMQKPHPPIASSGMVARVSPVIKNEQHRGFDFTKKETTQTAPVTVSVNKPVFSNSSWPQKSTPAQFSKDYFADFMKQPIAPQAPKVAPSTLFGESNQGIRERACAIALYVGGSSPTLEQLMTGALSMAQESGAKIYVDGNYRIALFSPRLLHSENNESSAINVARRIQALFLEHSRDHKEGLLFGIGINDGEIISEIEGGKFHFTSTGNLISLAKRIAQSSNMKLFISDSVRRKVISNVKVEKSPFKGVWEVTRVIDRSQSRDFINRFSDRNR